jgi:hypothetical protein
MATAIAGPSSAVASSSIQSADPAAEWPTVNDEPMPAVWLGSDLTMADIQPQVAQQPCFCLAEPSQFPNEIEGDMFQPPLYMEDPSIWAHWLDLHCSQPCLPGIRY